MGSRIFWILMVAVALVAGIVFQERDVIFASTDDSTIQERVFDHMDVRGSDGKPIDVAPETKRALGDAVGRLVSAETQLAMAKVRHADDSAVQQATAKRDSARADIERLKADIERQKQLSESDRDVMREQIRQKIRDDIRQSMRDAVRG